jgi:CHASE2 domain-containing sensor protein
MLSNKLIVIGHSSTLVGDYGATPFEELAPLCIIHATLASNILNDEVLEEASAVWRWTMLALLMLLALLINQFLLTRFAIPLVIVLSLAPVLVSYYLFTSQSIWLTWLPSSVGMLLLGISTSTATRGVERGLCFYR